MKYPYTPVNKVVETIHGHKVIDNYRWLEDGTNSKVKSWVKAQNKLTDSVLSPDLQIELQKEVERSFKFPASGVPYLTNGLYFHTKRKPEEDQYVLYVRKGINGGKRILIDPNRLSKDSGDTTTLDFWYPSPKARYLAYGISHNGNELSILKILDVESGKDLEVVAGNASYASIVWLDNEKSFYYTKHPEPGSVIAGEERYHQRVFYHLIGTDPRLDQEIFGEKRPKEEMQWLGISRDNKTLSISVNQDLQHDDIYLYDVQTKKLTELIKGYSTHNYIYFTEDKALILTNYNAPNYHILSADLNNLPTDLNDWQEFIPEKDNKLETYMVTKDQIIAVYLINAAQKTITYDLNGKETGKLFMPEHASIVDISGDWRESEFFYEFVSFITPGVIYRYDPKTKHSSEFSRMESVIDEADYHVKQKWYKSKDGTKVPMFIVHHKDLKLNGQNPTILYGYGGFESSVTPSFLRGFIPILKRGWIYASANIRGGGEFGNTWYQDGIKHKKQNSYDDFIAAAEYLIDEKYTNKRHLGILGASNGGLLVSAVAVQRPELFKAVAALVALTDMVRFPNFLIASRWISEYGDPSKAKDLANILKFSPYHNVKDAVTYPAFFLSAGSNDTRVEPMHAYKMTALLQSKKSKNPVLLYTNESAGHTGSAALSSYYREQARLLAFFIEQLS